MIVTVSQPTTTAESRTLARELEKLWSQFSTAALQLEEATRTGDEAHQQQLICDITAVQDPLETLVRTWEELATVKSHKRQLGSTAYLSPEQ